MNFVSLPCTTRVESVSQLGKLGRFCRICCAFVAHLLRECCARIVRWGLSVESVQVRHGSTAPSGLRFAWDKQKSPVMPKWPDNCDKFRPQSEGTSTPFLALQQRKKAVTAFLSQPDGCGDRTRTYDLRVMRSLKFVRYRAVLLGLVVLCTKARNRFCPMCTKRCWTVLTRSKPFWGQFWGAKSSCYSRKVFFPSAHLSAQLWSYCEHKFLEVHARANPCNISNNFYFPVSSCMPCPFQPAFATVSLLACIIAYYSPRCREKGPFLGNFQPYQHPCPPHHCDAWSPPFCGDFFP